MRKSVITASILGLALAIAPACASKKFVRTEVGGVNQKVDTLSTTVEQTQEATRRNEQRIGQVDQKAEAAAQSAAAAGKSAQDARAAADGAMTRANAVGTQVTATNGRINDVETAARRLLFTVTVTQEQGNFQTAKADLPDDTKAKLDAVVTALKNAKTNSFIEIEGHTDNVGTAASNKELGLERAEAVKRYLYEQHQIPLHKMNVISYGEEKPAAPNETPEGRAQNRRIVVKVLS